MQAHRAPLSGRLFRERVAQGRVRQGSRLEWAGLSCVCDEAAKRVFAATV